ncbi:beta-ketoacyl reductase, partial [Kitasatospora sp. NPDC004799]|uniref:acyl carrier protein n=1 Tax=Kitasatospora sp. NPDC004799 TaxID=3154460 RepID=UPI0033A9AC5B
ARRARGLAATAIAWGPWAGSGMAAEADAEEQLRRRGLHGMAQELATEALAGAIGGGQPAVTVADVDWERFAPGYTALRRSPLIGDLPEVQSALAAGQAGEGGQGGGADDAAAELRARLGGLTDGERRQSLLDLVRGTVAEALGHASAAEVKADRSFKDLGFDSLTAVELRNQLTAATGHRLPATLVFDHPTPRALAEHLTAELFPAGGDAAGPEGGEARIRQALATVPLSRLREAGVLETLLDIAGLHDDVQESDGSDGEEGAAAIDDMDVDSLIQMAFENTDSDS